MKLTKENYHSRKANKKYMSTSLFKSFLPQYRGCEARTMAETDGKWTTPENPAFLLGQYVHAWNEGDLQNFMSKNPALFKKDGTLYAKYATGDDMINALRNDDLAMLALEGEKEVIITEELFGVPWKIMIDSYNPAMKSFTDLKTCREINKTYFNEYTRRRENFIIYYGYDIGMAFYAEIERRRRKGEDHYYPHILAVSKEDPPDKELITFGTDFIPEILREMEEYMPRIIDVWKNRAEPKRCGSCAYCRSTKKLNEEIFYLDVGEN